MSLRTKSPYRSNGNTDVSVRSVFWRRSCASSLSAEEPGLTRFSCASANWMSIHLRCIFHNVTSSMRVSADNDI